MNTNLKISILVFFISIKSAAQAIIIPIIVDKIPSLAFIMIFTCVQFNLFFGIWHFILNRSQLLPNRSSMKKIILCGLFSGGMSVMMIYASSPTRAPIIMQLVLVGMAVLPSVLARKILINRIIVYNNKFIAISLLALIVSIIIASIPFFKDIHMHNILWSLLYGGGVLCFCFYNVMQEKIMLDTNDYSLSNKITIIFFSKCIELIFVLASGFAIEHNQKPIITFYQSIIIFLTNWKITVALEIFVILYMAAFILFINLNAISTNYSMMVPTISNPLVMLFFTIFSSFNTGLHYPLWITIVSMATSIFGMVMWMFGEKNTDPNSLSEPAHTYTIVNNDQSYDI